jgi:hypothetical protein
MSTLTSPIIYSGESSRVPYSVEINFGTSEQISLFEVAVVNLPSGTAHIYLDPSSFEEQLDTGTIYYVSEAKINPQQDAAYCLTEVLRLTNAVYPLTSDAFEDTENGEILFSIDQKQTNSFFCARLQFAMRNFWIKSSPDIPSLEVANKLPDSVLSLRELQSFTWQYAINPFVCKAKRESNIVVAIPNINGDPRDRFIDGWWWGAVTKEVAVRDPKVLLESYVMKQLIEQYNLIPSHDFEILKQRINFEHFDLPTGHQEMFFVRCWMNRFGL